jgi:hypothetical protein
MEISGEETPEIEIIGEETPKMEISGEETPNIDTEFETIKSEEEEEVQFKYKKNKLPCAIYIPILKEELLE